MPVFVRMSEVGKEGPQSPLVRPAGDERPAQSFLAPTLLQKQVVAGVALERKFSGTRPPHALLAAAVGFLLGHRVNLQTPCPEEKEKLLQLTSSAAE